MPVDPNISLGVKPMDLGQAPNVMNTVSRFADVQNKINENKLFQQTYQARQEAGKIIAGAPDFETGLQLLGHSQYAPFMGEFLGQARGAMLALTQQQGEQQKQYGSGLAAVLHGIAGGLTDPDSVKTAIDANLAVLPPEIRKVVEGPARSVQMSLTDGLPKDPEARLAEFHKRVVAQGLAAGISPEVINTQLPANETVETPAGIVQGLRQKPVLGGGFQPTAVMPKGMAQHYEDVPDPLTGQVKRVLIGGMPVAGAGGASVAPPVLGSTPTLAQKEELVKKGGLAGDIQSDMIDYGKALPAAVQKFDTLSGALKQFQSGGLADLRGNVAKVAQGLRNAGMDISEETLKKIGNGSLSGQQLFDSQIKPFVIGQLTAVVSGSGNKAFSREATAMLESANTTQDPAVLLKILNNAKHLADVGQDQSQKWPQYEALIAKRDPSVEKYGFEPANFYTWYNDKFTDKKALGATPPAEVPGTPEFEAAAAAKKRGAPVTDIEKLIEKYRAK